VVVGERGAVAIEAVQGPMMLTPVSIHYEVDSHSLSMNRAAGSRRQLTRAALDQRFLVEAPVVIVTCGIFGRISGGYGKPAENYVHMEVEHATQKFIFKH
jgi:hypothetical protein